VVNFRLLGPLEVVENGEPLPLGRGRQRALLALLLLHRNEAVSVDRIVDELWGERPPATAAKVVQVYVSALRKAVGHGRLESARPGYRLRLEPDELDADRVEALSAQARESEPRRKAALLREALDLWRGEPLADVAYDGFAQPEIARLEELRLALLEERIEAELALGQHAALVPELEALVATHPLRERLRALLMLALYRSGRQADALAAYQTGRNVLRDQLGLEPSRELQELERAILNQDSKLGGPRLSPVALRSRRRGALALAVGGLLVLVAAAAAVVLVMRGGGETRGKAGGFALALDPESGDVVARVPLGTAPSALAVGEGSVWVVDADDRTVSQIDATTRTLVRTFSTSGTPTDVAVGAGSVWVGNAPSEGNLLPTSITRLDAETGLVVDTIDLGARPRGHLFAVLAGFSRQHIAAAEDAVWVINPDLTVSRIDPRTNRIVARIGDVRAENIAVGEGQVWLTEGDRLAEIDPSLNKVAGRIRLDADFLAGVAVGAGAVWAADPLAGNLWRVDTGPGQGKRAIPLETWVAGVSFGEGAVWVTNEISDAVHRVDPHTATPKQVGEATSPRAVDAGEGGVWVTEASPPSENAALPASVCRDVYYGPAGSPDLLIVSSLPLQGVGRQFAQPMVDAIRRVLEQRRFEAGRFSVGYQSCDSSTAQVGAEDFFRCGFLAQAFGRNLRVVGVFGSFTSPCSYAQIPIANEAPGGPLAMISPSNTLDDLTADDDLYPTGTRNYFRLAISERDQGLAQVELARQLGRRRLFLLSSRAGEYVPQFQDGMRAYAKRVGVQIVGEASFDPDAKTFQQLVREVARTRPDSVALVGILTPGTAALIRELRSALDRQVALSAPDGFNLPEDLRKLAGKEAEGMYVTNYGVPNDRLPPRGKAFLESFASERGGDPGPDFAASYGAQGAEILLDAIARSDGTRPSVRKELGRTQIRNGILGDIAFDAKGDLVEGAMTILRFTRGDFAIDRIVHIRPAAASP
jgi:DNA-binding SARP family transcriptional activator/ABC-type branched-subunit amino acid transport system substrate-binding protein/DNA-binding beta-propeller fold protein YncE